MQRRSFLKKLCSSTALILAGLGSLLKSSLLRAEWNTGAFSAITEKEALTKFFPDQNISPSDAIEIGVYDLVENGAFVPVKINTKLPNIDSITILVEKNPNPLIASFDLGPACTGFIATRIKMDESSDIIAVVKSQGQLYSTRKFVEVVEGGCG